MISGIVLHDIAPVIEPKGLARIKSYVGKMPQPRSFTEGAEIPQRLSSRQSPKRPPPLLNEFNALARGPMRAIRGTNSDILSSETLAAMAARHPGLEPIDAPTGATFQRSMTRDIPSHIGDD
jgi:hypothetical protein